MRRPRLPVAVLLGAALGAHAAARSEELPVDLTIGYRFLDVSGNEDMYRSQLNERDGFLVRDLHVLGGDLGGKVRFADHFRLDAADVGAGPAGSVRLEVGRTGAYFLRASYSSFDRFTALPAFANPLLEKGITVGQHTADRTLTLTDVELQLLPGRVVTPFIGYTRNRYDGPGTTTYRLGEDEFHLAQSLAETDQELRVGASFAAGPISGSFSQGWRQFRGREEATLVPGAGSGNNTAPFLGTDVSAESLTRRSVTDVNTPVTNAFLAAALGPVRLSGAWVATRGKADTSETESAAGSFVAVGLERFFKGLDETVGTSADVKYWRGSVRAEFHLAPGLDVTAGYRKQRRELEGLALFNDLYAATLSFAGLSAGDVQVLLSTRSTMVREDETVDASASLKVLGPIALRASYQGTKQDLTLTEDVAEVVLAGGQGGASSRRIDRYEGSLTFSLKGVTLGAEARREQADEPVVRTDFIDRTLLRFRGSVEPVDGLRVVGTVDETRYTNDRPGIGFEGRTRSWEIDAEASIGRVVRLRAGGGRHRTDTSIPVRQPQSFSEVLSVYAENGKTLSGGATLTLPPVTFDALLTRFRNSGSWAVTLDRARVWAEVGLGKSISLIGEFDHDEYREDERSYGTLADYDANRYGLYLRWKQ